MSGLHAEGELGRLYGVGAAEGAGAKISAALAEIQDEYLRPHSMPWIVGFSAGKDSTLLMQLVFEMLLRLPRSERSRPIHVVSNDTQVESPLMVGHMHASLAKIGRAAEAIELPLATHVTAPDPYQTFWVNIIGRGYAPPNRRFRWCTDRMKIGPTTRFIKSQVSAAGEVVLLIGVRKAESAARAQSIERHTIAGQRLNPHSDLRGCMVFRPIMDFTTDEVWQTLLQRPCPWGGGRHRDLITLYRNAQAGECPVVIDRTESASCGGSARFGCWTCTVVDKDKSGAAMADAGFEEYEQLGEFRDWLRELQFQPGMRQLEKRNGKVTVIDGEVLPGPFSFDARQEILTRLLALQKEVGRVLITEDEINVCKRIWAEDLCTIVRRWLPVVQS